jgi:hypothetical protein
LGVFGFLAGQEIKDGGALNAGIRECRLVCPPFKCCSSLLNEVDLLWMVVDQQAALQWVQAHIDKVSIAIRCPSVNRSYQAHEPPQFGGDRERVTLYGESAGAGSVLQHVRKRGNRGKDDADLGAEQIIGNGGNTEPSLFIGAIASSPFEPPQYYYNDTVPQVSTTTSKGRVRQG